MSSEEQMYILVKDAQRVVFNKLSEAHRESLAHWPSRSLFGADLRTTMNRSFLPFRVMFEASISHDSQLCSSFDFCSVVRDFGLDYYATFVSASFEAAQRLSSSAILGEILETITPFKTTQRTYIAFRTRLVITGTRKANITFHNDFNFDGQYLPHIPGSVIPISRHDLNNRLLPSWIFEKFKNKEIPHSMAYRASSLIRDFGDGILGVK